MKKFTRSLIAICALVTLTGCGSSGTGETGEAGGSSSSSGSKVYKLATDQALDFPNNIALLAMADRIEEQTDGRIVIEIYPSSTLGDEVAYLQQLQFGAVDFAKASFGTLSQFSDGLNAMVLPYLFDSTEHMFKALDGEIGDELFEEMKEDNIIGLGYTNSGSRCFFTNTPVNSLDELKGLKLRVQTTPIMLGFVEAVGGFPQGIAANEVYSSLQTGVVQGAENNINIYMSESYYEQAPYYIKDNHSFQSEVLIASKSMWDGLSPEDQELIQKEMDLAIEHQRELWIEQEKASEEFLLEKGVTFYEPTPEEIDTLREMCNTVYEDPSLGLPYADLVARIRDL